MLVVKLGFNVMLICNLGSYRGHFTCARHLSKAVQPNFHLLLSWTDRIMHAKSLLYEHALFSWWQQLSKPAVYEISVCCETLFCNYRKQNARTLLFWYSTLNLGSVVYLQSQLYVGRLEVTHSKKLLKVCQPQGSECKTKNIVYSDALTY